MTIPDRPTHESGDDRWLIRITDDGSPTLVERATGDAMHSGCGARAETDHVYLTNSGLRCRLERGLPTRVLEVGLGSGLGCLMTMQLANVTKTTVEYVALEKMLTPADVIKQLKLEQQGIDAKLIDDYCELLSSEHSHQTLQATVGTYGHLTICLGDAAQWTGSGHQAFDVIYFDPYSPDSNGELWNPSMLTVMKQVLVPEGKLVSYCVSRRVRDNLAEAGFAVERVPGPVGGKREVLIARATERRSSIAPTVR